MMIASGSVERQVKFHEAGGQLVHTHVPSKRQSNPRSDGGRSTGFTHMTWSKDGSWMSLIPVNYFIEVISLRDNNVRHLSVIKDIREPSCASFQHATKKQIAVGTRNGAILIYDFKSRAVTKEFPRVDSSVFKLHYCHNDSHLICGCSNGQIMVFNAQSLINVTVFRIPKSNTLSTVRCHPRRRNLIVGGSENGVVAVWDINSKANKYAGQQHHAIVTDAMFVPNRSDLVVSIGTDRKICFQDIENRINIIDIALDRNVNCMDMCHNGVNLAVGMHSGHVLVYDIRNTKAPTTTFIAHEGPVNHIALRPQPPNASKSEISQEDHAAVQNGNAHISDNGGTSQNRRTISLCSIPESQSEHEFDNGDEDRDSFLAALSINASASSAGGAAGVTRRLSTNRRSTATHEGSAFSDADDSFLNAMGLGGITGSRSSSARNSRPAHFPQGTLPQDNRSNTPIIEEQVVLEDEEAASSMVCERKSRTKLLDASSTPNVQQTGNIQPYAYSPIYHVPADEQHIRKIVQEEIRDALWRHTTELRQHLFGMEYQLVKHARKTEDKLNEIDDALRGMGQKNQMDIQRSLGPFQHSRIG